MKKTLVMIATILLLSLSTACNNDAPLSSSHRDDSILICSTTEVEAADSHPDQFYDTESIKNFIYSGNFFEYDGWVYYLSDAKELRKCRSDLTADTLIEDNVYEFYIQNTTLYFVKLQHNNEKTLHISDLSADQSEFQNEIELKSEMYSPILYGNSIIYLCCNKLMSYDITNEESDTIVDDLISSFSVVDHYIYYDSCDSASIFRYDFNTGKTETFLTFESHADFQPKVYYRNRMMIIQITDNEFIYSDIDSGVTKTVSFDTSAYEKGWVTFHFVHKESLYFSVSEHYDVSNPTASTRSLCKVKFGTEKIEFIESIMNENVGVLIEGYRYFFDSDGTVCREKISA